MKQSRDSVIEEACQLIDVYELGMKHFVLTSLAMAILGLAFAGISVFGYIKVDEIRGRLDTTLAKVDQDDASRAVSLAMNAKIELVRAEVILIGLVLFSGSLLASCFIRVLTRKHRMRQIHVLRSLLLLLSEKPYT